MKSFIVIGAVFGFLAVAAGAFGAHALKSRLSADFLVIFETAVRYQMVHALALILSALVFAAHPHSWIKLGGFLFVAGILIFSGSLYLLVFSGVKAWGAVTPVGGLALLAGWLALAFGTLRS